jgi:GPH family glycoside/pentoside/hexuronide:cation symporter
MPTISETAEAVPDPSLDGPPVLSWGEKISFGQGEVASNLSWTMVGGFLLYYYTNVAVLPVAVIGTILLLSRGLDAFADPVFGLLMDRTHTRIGRSRPYLLYGTVPLGILSVLVFISPFHGESAKIAWAYVTLLLIGLIYSAVSIPYGALVPLMTKNNKEKIQLGSLRSIGSSVGAVLVTSLVTPMVAFLGKGNAQQGYMLTALAFAILGTALYFLVFFVCKERYLPAEKPKSPPILKSFSELVQNRMFTVTTGFTFIHLVRIGCILAVTVYFALLVMHAPWMIPFLFGVMSVGSIFSASLATPYFTRLGFRKGNAFALIFSIAAYCGLPFLEGHPVAFIALYLLACVGSQVCTTAVFAMVANSTDYHELRFHSRIDGLIFSSLSLSTKIGIALGAAIAAYGLSLAHYDPKILTHSAWEMIRALYYLVPAAMMVCQILVIQLFPSAKK